MRVCTYIHMYMYVHTYVQWNKLDEKKYKTQIKVQNTELTKDQLQNTIKYVEQKKMQNQKYKKAN